MVTMFHHPDTFQRPHLFLSSESPFNPACVWYWWDAGPCSDVHLPEVWSAKVSVGVGYSWPRRWMRREWNGHQALGGER